MKRFNIIVMKYENHLNVFLWLRFLRNKNYIEGLNLKYKTHALEKAGFQNANDKHMQKSKIQKHTQLNEQTKRKMKRKTKRKENKNKTKHKKETKQKHKTKKETKNKNKK